MKGRDFGLKLSLVLLLAMIPPAFSQGSSYDEGLRLYKANNFGAAANKLLEATKGQTGKEASAFYYLGCCYYKLNRAADARALYRNVVTKYPSSHEAGLASQMLQRLDPNYVAPAGIGGAKIESASPSAFSGKPTGRVSSEKDAELAKEMATLPDEVRFPFVQEASGHMRVTAYIDNRPVEAWFDTGASAHFGKNHFRAAGINEPQGEPNSRTSGWAGTPVPIWVTKHRLKIGNLTRNVPVSCEEDMAMMPLLGQEIIKGYQCEVDNGSHYVILRKANRIANTVNDLYDVPCVTRGSGESSRDYVTMEVNGKKMSVLIDTGASDTIFSVRELKKIGIEVPDDAPQVTMQGVGGGLSMNIMNLDLRLGPIRRQGFPAKVGDVDLSAVGQNFIGDQRFTIDREKKLMRFFH